MADTGKSAEDIFKDYMMTGWKHLPIWMKPVNDTYTNSRTIKMVPPPQEYRVKHIGSTIFPVTTAEEGGIDRMKTHSILVDEGAKAKRADVYRRHGVSKPTASQHTNIHGYMAYPSTVEEMEEGGGAYKDLWDSSDFYVRNSFGNTISGLLRIFQPTWDGLDGYIDYWGQSVINAPTEDQIKYAPPGAKFTNGIGAKQALESEVQRMLTSNSPTANKEYREYIRKWPLKVADCWIGTAGDLGFDTIALDKREAELRRMKNPTVRGNLEWFNGVIDHPQGVVFRRDREGRFEFSNLLVGQNNKWKWTNGATIWDEERGMKVKGRMPLNPLLCTAGADPFDYGNTPDTKTHSLKSKGGFYVMLNYDHNIDGDLPPEQQTTGITICTYAYNPPSIKEFCEDVLMGCLFTQSMLVVERNKAWVWKHFIDRGYGGFLMYMQNSDGTIHQKPGLYTGQGYGDKDNYFNAAQKYINENIFREKHLSLIEDMKSIQRPDQLRHHDLLTAAMVAWVGTKYGYQQTFQRVNNRTAINLKGTILDPTNQR
jgi:hypothetical protein